jgi:hypothetical protein
MMNSFEAAIENLYAVFSVYEGKREMRGSPVYGALDDWNKEITSKPLRELSSENLALFSWKAMTTWGDVEDFKHYLPIIFELYGNFVQEYDVWVIFGKLEYGKWEEWPEEEKNAIENFFISLFEKIITCENNLSDIEFENYFTAIAHLTNRFEQLLEIWEQAKTKSANKFLGTFIYSQFNSIFHENVISGFQNCSKNIPALKKWLVRKEIAQRLEKAFFEFQKEDFASEISWAEQLVRQELEKQIK